MQTITQRISQFVRRNSHQVIEKKRADGSEDSFRTMSLLGIKFFSDSLEDGIDKMLNRGGLCVFPSGPGIAQDFPKSEAYRQALQQADFAFGDSGAMVLLWRLFTGGAIPRYSGLQVLKAVIARSEFRESGATFWVMPSPEQMERNLTWLQEKEAITVERSSCHVAPQYPEGFIEAPELVARLEERKPSFVVLCIGGGTQERLGLCLQKSLSYRPTILCIGAAIGFLNGAQANIPTWADRAKLGWLVRCIDNPRVFVPRYWKALRLIQVLAFHWLTGHVPGPRKVAFTDEMIGEMTEAG